MEPERDGPGDKPVTAPSPDALRARLVVMLQMTGALRDPAVERAFRAVPRHLFLPGVPLADAYADTAIATHWEEGVAVSSASQPAMVAVMLEQLRVEPGMRVLEIGAGTGYNAALLAELVGPSGAVTTLDIDAEIVAEAGEHLAAAGCLAVRAIAADGAAGWPEGAPYDRVILTVGASDIAPAWVEQLCAGGLLVIPLWLGGAEASVAFRKRDGLLVSESLSPCGFMRLRGVEAGVERVVALPGGRRLFGERAAELAEVVAALLATRPVCRFWPHPAHAFLEYLGLRGHDPLALIPARMPRRARGPRGRWGVYLAPPEGPSLALFALTSPALLTFGTPAAARLLEAEATRWRRASLPPLERWRVTARPVGEAGAVPVPAGVIRLARRHFAFDVEPGVAGD